MNFNYYVEILKNEFNKPLPGFEVQKEMLPSRTSNLPYRNNYKNSAVLLLLYPVGEEVSTVFIERPKNTGPHSQQISFAGGGKELFDKTLIDTALREANEEIGVVIQDVSIVGKLSKLYIPVSNYLVQPIVGICKQRPKFVKNPNEVDEVIEVEISKLNLPANKQITGITRNNTTFETPCYIAGTKIIWGATAMILCEFLAISNKLRIEDSN